MADFATAFTKVLKHEGGYIDDPDDTGGETYKGIARNIHPQWPGWNIIDQLKATNDFPSNLDRNQELQLLIRSFYKETFWHPIKGDEIQSQLIAESIFDFCVNAGLKTGIVIAQTVIGINADGIIGPVTLKKLNGELPELFLASFTIGKIARYVHLVKNRPAYKKFFFGWVRRAIGDI
jgi:lysozyme family protein